jgi:hypothetical protein
MEYPTFFSTDSVHDPAPGTRDRYDLDFVTVHEFAHMYLHGILASNEFEEPMLDEGLNEYWNVRMLGERPASLAVLATLLDGAGAFAFGGFPGERFDAPREEPADPVGQNAYDRLDGIGPAYSRTAVVLHDLQAQLGTEVFDRAFREYYRRWQFRHPGVADLREALAEASGQRALGEKVFAQHVYAARKVDDRIASITSEEKPQQPGYATRQGRLVEITPAMLEADARVPFKTTVVRSCEDAKGRESLRDEAVAEQGIPRHLAQQLPSAALAGKRYARPPELPLERGAEMIAQVLADARQRVDKRYPEFCKKRPVANA